MCIADLKIAMACGENTVVWFAPGAGGLIDIPRNLNRIGLTLSLSHNTAGEQVLVSIGPDFSFPIFILNNANPIIQLSLQQHGKWIQRGFLITNNAVSNAFGIWSEAILPTAFNDWKDFWGKL